MNQILTVLIFISLNIFSLSATATSEDRLGQARLFLGSTQTQPTELNTELAAQGLKKVDLNNKFGVEITFPFSDKLSGGLRYSKYLISQDEINSSSATDYKVGIDQDIAALVGRFIFYKTEFLHLDTVLGVGGSNTNYEIKTATQNGSLTKKGTPFASLYSTGGVSLALGKEKYFFVIEGGYESQKIDSFDRSGTINSNVKSIDLSGPYLTIGFMFEGIPISKGK